MRNTFKLNKKQLLFKNKVIEVRLCWKIRPGWIKEKETLNIFFHKLYKSNSDGEILAIATFWGEEFPLIVKEGKKIIFNFDPDECIEYLLSERYITKKRPLYTFFPFHYHKFPFRIALTKIKYFFLKKNFVDFPSWPIDTSVEAIRYMFLNSLKLVSKNVLTSPLWPDNKKFGVSVTHDIDTEEGFDSIKPFLEIEKKLGITSCINIVPQYYKISQNLIDTLKSDGFEIGIHGYNHSNKLPYLTKKQIIKRFNCCKAFIRKNGAKGFRSPSLLLSERLIGILPSYFIYDSSIPDTERYLADSKASGCCSVFPFLRGRIIEIPLTVPMDATMICAGFTPEQIYKIWLKKAEWIKKVGGLVLITTHPEKHYSGKKSMLKIYGRILKLLRKDKDAHFDLPKHIAQTFRKRLC